MSCNYKRSNVETGNGGDILVTLPRELIHRILDWLPVRDAARTSILSTNWRYIWSANPRLLLDASFFEANFKNKRDPIYAYVNAINSIILLHNGPVQLFYLYIPNQQSDMNQHVFQWLIYLSKNGINNLIVDNRHISQCTLPSHVLSHPELQYSKLRNCLVKVPKDFDGFSKLTYLQLDRLSFTPGIFGNFVAPAPALKRLTFKHCTGIEHFKISSPRLKTFSIIESSDVQLTNFENIPDLNHLNILLGKKVSIRKQCMEVLLQRFPRLKRLSFDIFSLELFSAATGPEPNSTTFGQLTDLNLLAIDFDNVDQMLRLQGLLKSCPNIEELNIWASAARDGTRSQNTSHSVTYKCGSWTLSKLTSVSISSINGLTTELDFIEMLLASAPMLKQMSINYRETMDAIKRFDMSNKLLDFTRASTKARIKYMKKKPENMGFRYPYVPRSEDSSFWR